MAVEAPPAPAPAPAAPPPAPPSKPAKPSAPASTAKNAAPVTTSKPVSEPADNFDDAIFKLGEVADKESGQAAAAPTKEAQPPPKPADDPPDETPGEPPAKPVEEPTKPAPVKARTLRELADELKGKNAELEKKLQTLEAEKAKVPTDDPEKKKLSETLAEREKRLAELEEEQRFSNYERSQEYQDKWLSPFTQAYESGRARVASLKLTDENGNVRQGTAQDFDALMQITDPELAADRAAEWFGNKASMVMYHREKAIELNTARVNALEEYRKNGTAREQQRQEQGKKFIDQITKEATEYWQRHRTAPHEKHPLFFKPIEGDDAGNKLLEDGFKEADEAFAHMNALDPRLTTEQRDAVLRRHAIVYNKAAAFNRLAHLLKTERSLRMSAEKKLKDFENSEPGPGDGAGGGAPALDTMGQAVSDLNKYIGR